MDDQARLENVWAMSPVGSNPTLSARLLDPVVAQLTITGMKEGKGCNSKRVIL